MVPSQQTTFIGVSLVSSTLTARLSRDRIDSFLACMRSFQVSCETFPEMGSVSQDSAHWGLTEGVGVSAMRGHAQTVVGCGLSVQKGSE